MKYPAIIVGLIIIIGGGWFLLRGQAPAPVTNNAPIQAGSNEAVVVPPTTETPAVTIVSVSAKNFEFTPKEIRVKKGNKVRIEFKSESGFHDWVVDEFNAKTKRVNTGESDM